MPEGAMDNAMLVDVAGGVRDELDAPMVVLCVLDKAGRLHITTSFREPQRGLAAGLVDALSATCSAAGMPQEEVTPERRRRVREHGDA
jgi:hypothetical protein